MAWRATSRTTCSRRLLKHGSEATRSAPGRAWAMSAKALSISVSSLALKTAIVLPIARAAVSDSRTLATAAAKFGFNSAPIVEAAGTTSRSSPRRFSASSVVKMLIPSRIAAGPGKAGYEPAPDRIGAGVEYDWDSCGRLLSRRSGCFAADRDDNGDPAGYEVGRQGWHPVVAPLCPAILDDDVAPHLEPHLLQTATEAFVEVQPERRRGSGKKDR